MGIPSNIRSFLEQSKTTYEVMRHPRTTTLAQAADACRLGLHDLVRALMLVDSRGLLMAILPADHLLDFDAVHRTTGRRFELVPSARLREIFADCEPGSFPPLGPAYGLEVVIDRTLANQETIVFEPGDHTALMKLSGAAYRMLCAGAHYAGISRSAVELGAETEPHASDALSDRIGGLTPAGLRHEVQEIHELPALPGNAGLLLQLASNPMAGARQLAQLIEQDASLAAQVLRYANSSLYGYSGGVKDLQTAIARVLGFDFVLNLALGLSIGKALRTAPDGPLGLRAFWRHSVYAARLVEVLALQIEGRDRPERGAAYLAGLLQNIGRLILGHAFQPEFYLLNRLAEANPSTPVIELEKRVLGVAHDQIGAWLMESWGMPESLTAAVRFHHDPGYCGHHAVYPHLVGVANHYLAKLGIGEKDTGPLPGFSLEMMGLNAVAVEILAEQVVATARELDDLAQRLSA